MRVETLFAQDVAWAILPTALEKAVRSIESLDVKSVTAKDEQDSARAYLTGKSINYFEDSLAMGRYENVAVIPVQGALRPKPSYSFWGFGYGSSNLLTLSHDLKRALDDDMIDHIILDIDSPGGLVNGTEEFARLVAEASQQKNVVSYCQEYCASAAYWIASQSSEIVAGATAQLGSIGTVATYIDWSKYDERVGIKEIVMRSSQSPNKNLEPTSDKGAELIQTRLDALSDVFIASVARGRKRTTESVIQEFGQGDLSVGEQAVAVGLADRLGSFDALLSELTTTQDGVSQMTDNQAKATALQPGVFYQADANGNPQPVALTPELVQEKAPQVADALRAEGKETGIAEGKAEGMQSALENVKQIEEAFPEAATKKIVDGMKYNDGVTKAEVALAIVEAQQAGELDYTQSLDEDSPPPLGGSPDDSGGEAKDPKAKASQEADNEFVKRRNASRGR